MNFDISINKEKLEGFSYPLSPSFGTVVIPVTLWSDISHDKNPHTIKIDSETNFSFSGFTSAFHYGQSIFEGMKAFRLEDGRVAVFRLDEHAKRFQNSAKIMGMPEIDTDLFKECILKYLECCKELVPKEEGHSLYLRPLMIATDPVIKVKSSENYRFMVMSSIVGPYFSSGKKGTKVYCHEMFTRAFPNGTGEAKTAANYALSLPHLRIAQKLGYEQVLYLDSETHEYIEELGGMNFFMIKGKSIITPKLDGTILSGITRKSLLKIAENLGYKIEERDIKIKELIERDAEISAFATGTAATVVPLLEIGFQEKGDDTITKIEFNIHSDIEILRDYLLNTQLNKSELSHDWLTIL